MDRKEGSAPISPPARCRPRAAPRSTSTGYNTHIRSRSFRVSSALLPLSRSGRAFPRLNVFFFLFSLAASVCIYMSECVRTCAGVCESGVSPRHPRPRFYYTAVINIYRVQFMKYCGIYSSSWNLIRKVIM